MATTKAQPVHDTQLHLIAKDACETTLTSATSYQHTQTESWNSSIINKILNSLLTSAAATTSTTEDTPSEKPKYKYAVNSTIIQHLEPSSSTRLASTGTSTETSSEKQTAISPEAPEATETNGVSGGSNGAVVPEKGRRGMHSATGAYWNESTDGMWNYKWEGGDDKGMDVVISVIWIAI